MSRLIKWYALAAMLALISLSIYAAGGGNDDTDPEEYAKYFPALLWVVRDFTLQLVDAD